MAAKKKKRPAKKNPKKKAKAAPAKKKSSTKKAAKAAPKKKAAKAAPKKKSAAKKPPPKKAAPKKATTTTAPKKAVAKVADVKKVAKIGPKPTTTIVQHVFIQATPEQVFDALVQPALAASIIGGECTGEPRVGSEFTHWNGYIHGKHVELLRGERIVQEWTTTEWPKGAAASRLELQLAGTGGGTELTMTHSNVPSEQAEEYRQGWIDFYWTPMRAHFGG
jgi:activator of HSP90 ATPase